MRTAILLLLPMVMVTMGFGCKPRVEYVPAPETPTVEVPPSAEGAKASTGGESATITPPLATELLVQALPPAQEGGSVTEPVETLHPAPMLDGTRTEYTAVSRVYSAGDGKTVSLTLTDTRGIPAVAAFLDSFEEREDELGYRKRAKVGDRDAWMNFASGSNGETDGSGSLFMLVNNRFLIQLDGGVGTSPQDLIDLAGRFRFDALR